MKDFLPLHKVVAAAIVDTYEDKGKVKSYFFHWAARAFKSINNRILKFGRNRAVLHVNKNTRTAALPTDFQRETFVGIIKNGEKIPLSLNYKLVDSVSVAEAEGVERCPKCSQDKGICDELEVTEDISLIVINGTSYEQNTVKKLYPNGDYYLETSTPYLNTDTAEVEFLIQKKFIANLDLKACGCLETTEENMETLAACCPSVYGCYYAPCNAACSDDFGGYRIFEETGLIQFDSQFKGDTAYLEYEGFLPKINGQLCVPATAFEATVEETKYKSVKNKKSEPLWRINHFKNEARVARNELTRTTYQASLKHIEESVTRLPKFDIKRERWHTCFTTAKTVVATTTTNEIEPSSGGSGTGGGTTVVEVTRLGIVFGKRKFEIGETGSPMAEGQTSLIVKNASGVIETNVLVDSVNVVISQTPIQEIEFDAAFSEDQLEYKVQYTTAQTTILFNQEALATQKYMVSYAKTL